jgi:hypothetical protein
MTIILALNTSRKTKKRTAPSFSSNKAFYERIDKLPGGTKWQARVIHIEGDRKDPEGVPMKEEVELWMRDPVECAAELMSNPAFKEHMQFASQYLVDRSGQRIYNKMWTAEWWAEVEVRRDSRLCVMTD